MISLKGINLDELGFELIMKDLILDLEDNRVIHYVNTEGEDFLKCFIESNNKIKRWLIFKVNHIVLHYFFSGTVLFSEVLLKAEGNFIYIKDMAQTSGEIEYIIVSKKEIPKVYLKKLSFSYIETDYTPYTKHLIKLNEICASMDMGK